MGPDATRTRSWGLALLLGCAVACDDGISAEVSSGRDAATLEPSWSGCWTLDDGRCEVSSEQVRVWMPRFEASWRWTLDEQTIDPPRVDVEGGVRFSFDAPAFERPTHVLALRDLEGGAVLFSLELVPDPVSLDGFAFGDEVEGALASGAAQVRRDAAEVLLAGASASRAEAVARVHFARILAFDGRDPGSSAEAVLGLLEREERVAAEHGLWGVRCRAALVGLFWGTFLERPSLTRRWGRLETRCRERSADLGARFDHYLGTQALHDGQYAEAEARLARASVVSKRLTPERRVEAATQLMDLYVRTARWSEAKRELKALQASPLEPCARAQAESAVGFARVRAWQSGEADLGDPRPGLESALRLHAPGAACENVALYTHDLVKLGYAAALRGDAAALRGYVERISAQRLDGKYAQQVVELELELAVVEQRFSEVPRLASKMKAMATRGEPEAWWRLHSILARAAIAQGDEAAAQAAYGAAETVLDELWAGVNSYALRSRWLSAYRRSALELMRLRLGAGDLEGAACVARSARLRAMEPRGLRGRFDDPCERAWARGAGEVVFLIVPETRDDWHVFTIAGERVLHVRRARAPSAADRVGWWDPWTDAIGSAGKVRILASGVALRAPLHQLGWRGEALIRRRPVTFGLDLAPAGTPRGLPSPAASVVFADADRYRALARYLPDVRRAHALLVHRGWSTRWIETSARPPSFAEAVAPGGLLVYYGHGERVGLEHAEPPHALADVGSTALLVGPETRWRAEDVAASEQVPRWAVLLGCDVAFPDVESWSGGLNLAHALLFAGTHEVLAAVGPLDAVAASEVLTPLLDRSSERFDLADALHRVWVSSPGSRADPRLGKLRAWSR